MYGWMNYGANGVGGVDGSCDISDVFQRMTKELSSGGTAAEQLEAGRNARRFYFDHMRSRVILTNTGTTPIFWEIYECTARKDLPLTEGNTLQAWLSNSESSQYQAVLPSSTDYGGGAISADQTSAAALPGRGTAGVTPFQFRHFCQNWKITKVTRLQAAPGNTVSFDASTPRNVTVNFDNYVDLLAKRGITKLFLVRQWGAVELISSVPTNSASSAVCEIEKDYNCKVLDRDLPQLNYISYTNTVE